MSYKDPPGDGTEDVLEECGGRAFQHYGRQKDHCISTEAFRPVLFFFF